MSNNTATIKTRKNLVSTRTITMTALLAAISYVLAFLILESISQDWICTDWGSVDHYIYALRWNLLAIY